MRRTSSPIGRSSLSRSAVVGVVAGLTIGGGVALVGGLPSGLGAMSTVSLARQTIGDDAVGSEAIDESAVTERIDRVADHAAEHETHLRDALAPLVQDGTLTETQVDAIVAALADAAPMPGRRGHGGFEHRDAHGLAFGASFDAVAELLGITLDDLQSALDDGQSLADLAEANGSTAEAVVEVLIADLAAHLDEEVANGEHTQAEADERLAAATERITAMVNGDMPSRGGFGPAMGEGSHAPGGPGHLGPRGGHGPGPGSGHGGSEAPQGELEESGFAITG